MKRKDSVLLLMLLSGASVFAATDGVQWDFAFGNEGRNYNPTAIGGAPDGGLFVAGTSSAPGLSGMQPEFWLWKIDRSGKLVVQTPIAAGAAGERINPSALHVRDIATHAGGGAIIIEFRLGEPYFMAFDANARITAFAPLTIVDGAPASIHRLLPLSNAQFLGLGEADGRAVAVRIANNGEILWRKFVDEGVSLFADGVVNDDGTFVAVGYTVGKLHEFSLTKFAADGTARDRVSLPGRKVSIAGAADAVTLVYDRSGGILQDMRIATVVNGAVNAETKIETTDPSFMPPYQIAAIGANRYLIAGTTENGIIALRYQPGAALARMETKRKSKPRHWSLQRVSGHPAAALTVVYTGGEQLTTKVGVIRFQ
jgi:hypothetical protein